MTYPTEFCNQINYNWIIPEASRINLQEYFLLYHSADYIRNNSWEAGRILRNGTFYHVVFYGECRYNTIRKAEPTKQFALSFRCPSYHLRNKYKYLVPTVLIADPTTINCNGLYLYNQKESNHERV
jgi:hypothetical protein